MRVRVNDRAIHTAERFDGNLAERLRDGTVSEVDRDAALNILSRFNNTPRYGDYKWKHQAESALNLYQEVDRAIANQDRDVTWRETRHDRRDPANLNRTSWGERREARPNDGWRNDNWRYPPPQPQVTVGQAIAVVGVAAIIGAILQPNGQ